jgi:hypothetical protein
MTNTPQQCPKCNGQFEAGYLPDASYAAQAIGRWASGSPNKSFLGGTKFAKETVPICAFRCNGCGYIEIYAREEFAPQ